MARMAESELYTWKALEIMRMHHANGDLDPRCVECKKVFPCPTMQVLSK